MALIAFGVLVCAYGELNLVVKGLVLQLSALGFEVRAPRAHCTHALRCLLQPEIPCGKGQHPCDGS